MKHTLCMIAVALTVQVMAQSKKNKALAGYTIDNYEVACMGVGTDGSKLIKIWGYGKTAEKAQYQAKLNAVHAMLFKGVTAATGGCQGIKPICGSFSVEQEFQDYFNNFFTPGGAYLNFVALSGEGGDNMDVTKIDSKTYKVGIYVSVMYDALRTEMEKAGTAKKLDAGF